MTSIDLTRNPFAVLSLSPRDRRPKIERVYEEVLSDGVAVDEQELTKAQQKLMASKARLEAEVMWFPDIAPSTVRSIMNSLVKGREGRAEAILNKIEGLGRANLAAHLCAKRSADINVLRTLIASQAEYSVKSVLGAVNANRAVSKFPRVNYDLVEEALRSVQKQHCDAAWQAVMSAAHPGKLMTDLVENLLESEGPPREFLENLVDRYAAWSAQKFREIGDQIEAEAEALRSNPADESAIEAIVDKLSLWNEYSQALELIYQAKGLDELKSRKLCDGLRDLSFWLANESFQFSAALKILEALRATFQELPSLSEQLSTDIKGLKVNQIIKDLEKALKEGRFDEALGLLDQGIAMTTDPEVRAQLKSYKSTIQKKVSPRQGRWLIWAGIAAAVVILIAVSQKKNRSSYSNYSYKKTTGSGYSSSSSSTRSTPPKAVQSTLEVKPRAGGSVLKRAELRYCLFQRERLATIVKISNEDMALAEGEMEHFNQLKNEWSDLCKGRYYDDADFSVVQRELVAARPRLQTEAKAMLRSWSGPIGKAEVLLNPYKYWDAVKIQRRLAELGYYDMRVDGIWGPGSRAALTAFKRDYRLQDPGQWDASAQAWMFAGTGY